MQLSDCCIVMHETSHPGNIGAAARAMKTMGLTDLRLVATVDPNDKQAYTRSSGAQDILFKAQSFSDIAAAVADCHLCIGLSARVRAQQQQLLLSTELAQLLTSQPAVTRCAFIFGNEQSGLDNAALSHCHYQVKIPTNPEFSSLNIASCIQIIAYICATTLQHKSDDVAEDQDDYHAVTLSRTESLLKRVLGLLAATKLSHPQTVAATTARLRQIIQNAKLTDNDIDLLHGVLKIIDNRKP